ncbi:MAG: hypothetical protein ACOC1O_06470 [bacterium]
MIIIANLLQEDIKKSAKELGWYHRRYRDVIGKFGSASDFDELVINNGKSLGLECKMLGTGKSNPKSFPFSKVSDEQMIGLINFSKQFNSKGFLIINFRYLNSHKGRTFALTIQEFLYLRWVFPNHEEFVKKYPRNDKSIPLEYFKEEVLELQRLGKGWDLRTLINRRVKE